MFRWIFLVFISLRSAQPHSFPGRIFLDEQWIDLAVSRLVIFNLVDLSLLIEHGWRPVIDTNNTVLTESTLSSLDLLDVPISNQTHFALRTPPLPLKPMLIPLRSFGQTAPTIGEKNSTRAKETPGFSLQNPFYPIHLFCSLAIVWCKTAQGHYLRYWIKIDYRV